MERLKVTAVKGQQDAIGISSIVQNYEIWVTHQTNFVNCNHFQGVTEGLQAR
ncbi:hypothetical protein MAN88_18790 [Microcystis aeruginosa]|nr:hypothetical protein MAN88_18790 [Microcystis aeruginosa]